MDAPSRLCGGLSMHKRLRRGPVPVSANYFAKSTTLSALSIHRLVEPQSAPVVYLGSLPHHAVLTRGRILNQKKQQDTIMARKFSILALSAASITALSFPLHAQDSATRIQPLIVAQAENLQLDELSQRLAKLRNSLESAQSDDEKQQIAGRIAKIEQRIAKIKAETAGQAVQTPEANTSPGEQPAEQPTVEVQPAEPADGQDATAEAQPTKKKPNLVEQPSEAAQSSEDKLMQPTPEAKAETAETPPVLQVESATSGADSQQDPTAEATAGATAETESAMTEKEKQRVMRRQERREAGRAARQQEAEKADDVQTAIQTIEAIKPTAEVKIVIEDGQKVQQQQFRSNDGRIVEKRILTNRDGDKVVITKVTRPDGTVVERKRVIDSIDPRDERRWRRIERRDRRSESGVDVVINIPFGIDLPPERYVVDGRGAPIELIYDVLRAEPVRKPERRYSIDEVTQSEQVRALMPRIDLDTINFEFGQAEVADSQIRNLEDIATAMHDVLSNNPNEVFLLEGHTDAVGSELYNLQLSELRAQSVKYALVDGFGLPEDAFVTEGYGEEYLKVPTEEAERLNRRATVRRITELVQN